MEDPEILQILNSKGTNKAEYERILSQCAPPSVMGRSLVATRRREPAVPVRREPRKTRAPGASPSPRVRQQRLRDVDRADLAHAQAMLAMEEAAAAADTRAAGEWCRAAPQCCECGGEEHSLDVTGLDPLAMAVCDACEMVGIHLGCLSRRRGGARPVTLDQLSDGEWYCSPGCESAALALDRLDCDRVPVPGADLHTLEVVRHDPSKRPARMSTGAALSIFREAFDMAAPDSARGGDGGGGEDPLSPFNLADSVLHQRAPALAGQPDLRDYRTVLLRRAGCVVTAGCVRLRGNRFCELPFVATKEGYRRGGNLRVLVGALESLLLAPLDVRHLVVPAAKSQFALWSAKLGFSRVSPSESRCLDGLVLDPEGTVLLKRPVRPCCEPEGGAGERPQGDGGAPVEAIGAPVEAVRAPVEAVRPPVEAVRAPVEAVGPGGAASGCATRAGGVDSGVALADADREAVPLCRRIIEAQRMMEGAAARVDAEATVAPEGGVQVAAELGAHLRGLALMHEELGAFLPGNP